jgi:ketosteroid isomerase-like protein
MTQDSDEIAIRALLDAQAQAIRSKEVDATLSPYGPDLVRFDLAPPLATKACLISNSHKTKVTGRARSR